MNELNYTIKELNTDLTKAEMEARAKVLIDNFLEAGCDLKEYEIIIQDKMPDFNEYKKGSFTDGLHCNKTSRLSITN